MNALQLAVLFTAINKDEQAEGQEAVPLSDTDFYTDQIFALFENMDSPITEERARELAVEMAGLTP